MSAACRSAPWLGPQANRPRSDPSARGVVQVAAVVGAAGFGVGQVLDDLVGGPGQFGMGVPAGEVGQ